MIMHEFLFLPGRQILLSVHFLLFAAQMALLFACFRDGRRFRMRFIMTVHPLAGFLFFYLMMQDIYRGPEGPGGIAAEPAIFAVFCSFPVYTAVLYEVFTAAVLAAEGFDLVRYRKRHPTSRSIKETMDLLPAGIAFFREDGSAAMHNLVMDDLSGKISGKSFAASRNFWLRPPGTVSIKNPSGKDCVWQIASGLTDVGDETFTQLTATDITVQTEITKELEEKNEKLRDIRMRLNIYNIQAERMITAQELLAARMAVHNELGNVLLESRHFLNDPSSFDAEMLLRALKNTNTYLLREYEEDDSAGDPLTDVLEMAEAIGVDVTIAGITPQAEPGRSVLAAAIMECATNTVKHAGGNALAVKIHQTDLYITVVLSGNGAQPRGEVRESGGLKSLRALVEKEGGTMEISLLPQLAITVSVPEKKPASGDNF